MYNAAVVDSAQLAHLQAALQPCHDAHSARAVDT